MTEEDEEAKKKGQEDEEHKRKADHVPSMMDLVKEPGPDGDQPKPTDIKHTVSLAKKKVISKSQVTSKSSLKKVTESALSSTLSEGSSSSFAMKRQSEFEKLIRGPKYQNTYRLDSKKPFKAHEVYRILSAIVLKETADFPVYDTLSGAKIVQTIAADIRNSVRTLNYDRYKILVLVYLGEKKLQGFQAAFRALWDHERDSYATYFHQSRTYFLSATCYGVYHD